MIDEDERCVFRKSAARREGLDWSSHSPWILKVCVVTNYGRNFPDLAPGVVQQGHGERDGNRRPIFM
jgi:hypothetical protein